MGNTEINTVEFWEEAKARIDVNVEVNKYDYYLCGYKKFSEIWQTEKGEAELKALGESFLLERGEDLGRMGFEVGRVFLFAHSASSRVKIGSELYKQVRLDFCDWNIERIKKGGASG